MTGPLHLRVTPPTGEPFLHVADQDRLVVGRALDCDLVLADAFLSRQQARLHRDADGWWIEDLGSRNGTLLNGERVVASRRLLSGDRIALSGSLLDVLDGPAARLHQEELKGGTTDLEELGEGTYFRSARELLQSGSLPLPAVGSSEGTADELRRWADRLRLVNEVHRDLGRVQDLETLLEGLLDRVFDHLRPERGAVYLRRAEGDEAAGSFYLAAQRPTPGTGGDEILHSRSLLREVAEKGLGALVLDTRTDERFAQAHSMLDVGVRSLVAAPLLADENPLGMIALGSRLAVRHFQREDLELLVSLASAAALRIRNLALAEEAAERRRLESELALARRIQVALLPERLPPVPGWQLHGGNLPSRGVSGDFYEVVERRVAEATGARREVFLVLSDVSGKGMAASLLTASLEALLAPLIEEGLGPAEIATRACRLLFQRTPPERYATAVLVAMDVESGRFRYTGAGHNPALVVRASGEVELLAATGPPLGLLAGTVYGEGEVTLDAGDALVLYTDGLVEAEDPDGEEYGLERMERLCRRHRTATPRDLARALEEDVEAFVRGVPFGDDRTLLIARRR